MSRGVLFLVETGMGKMGSLRPLGQIGLLRPLSPLGQLSLLRLLGDGDFEMIIAIYTLIR